MGKTVSKVNPQRKRVRFSKEFKLEAVRLLELGQKPATDLTKKPDQAALTANSMADGF